MKQSEALQIGASTLAGLTFGLGLAISGMTQPQKVIAFLDPWHWDPSLVFVMISAIFVHSIAYLWRRQLPRPVLDQRWHLPSQTHITRRLVLGSAIFGVGWGLGGFCPGPALASLATLDLRVVVFVGSMVLGMLAFRYLENQFSNRKP